MNKLVVALILGIIFSFAMGFMMGVDVTLSKVVEVARPFIEIDTMRLEQALWQYDNHIKNCYALNISDTGTNTSR